MGGEARSLLVADNDQLVREAVADFFRDKGFQVHVAADGLQALDMVRRVRPDCLILDIVMPKVAGARVCRLIREDPELHALPIIALSALSLQDFHWFPELSPDAYVAKGPLPAMCQHLLHAVDHIRTRRAGPAPEALPGDRDPAAHSLVREMFEDRQRLLDLLDALGGVVEVEPGGRILAATADACKLLGRRELDLIGESLASLCAPQDRDGLRTLIAEMASAPLPGRRTSHLRLGERKVRLVLSAIGKWTECRGLAVTIEPEA